MLKTILFVLFVSINSMAFSSGSTYVGLSYYSQNILNKTTTSASSAPSALGAASYPLVFKYDWNMFEDWYLSPQLSYTFLPRASAEDSAKVTILHLVFPVGKNFDGMGFGGGTPWDWFVGPGLIRYSIQGSSGTTVLSNGTGTATFALPGGNSTIQNITFDTGFSYNFGNSRLGFDLIFEGLLSSGKRSESIMIGYAYAFGGGGFR